MIINGGEVRVDGPSTSMNAAIDCGSENGGEFLVNGGSVIALGASGMLEIPDGASEQLCITFAFSQTLQAGTEVSVTDSTGNLVCSFTTAKNGNSVVLSNDALSLGETYTFTYGESTEEITAEETSSSNTQGFSMGGMGGPSGDMGGHGGDMGGPGGDMGDRNGDMGDRGGDMGGPGGDMGAPPA